MISKGLIYCRVSSKQQVEEGNGLSSQEKVCRDYAKYTLGIDIEKVFYDKGVSGGLFDRKGMQELLEYASKNKKTSYIFIIDDLNRLSRDVGVHHLLKNEFRKRNIEIACPNFKFENTPESALMENINVSVSQYEREKNKQRVISRQKARIEQGYWCFKVPVGYKYSSNKKGGKLVLLNEDNHKQVKLALNKFAEGEFSSVHDFIRYLDSKGVNVCPIKNGKVYKSDLAHRMLRNIFYAGYIEVPKWNIGITKAKHEALISLKTFEKIQKRLELMCRKGSELENSLESNLNRKDTRADFPLRGFLYCEESKYMLSASWSTGRPKKYPYYQFPIHSPMYGKGIRRDDIHKEFEELLISIQPKEDLIKAFEMTLKTGKEEAEKTLSTTKEAYLKEISKIENKISKYIDKLGDIENEVLIKSYEKKIIDLENEKNEILEKIEKEENKLGTTKKPDFKLVRNSLDIWRKADLENKKKLIKNIFPAGIPVNKKRQLGTASFSLIYQVFEVGKTSKKSMVEPMGFEPMS